ncbi:hypothetical protein GGI43DRAFT_169424 [Trichoderma evansii]
MAKAKNSHKTRVIKADLESQTSITSDYKRNAVYSPSEWLLETLSSIAALGLVIAIAAIFWFMDNKPLSAWDGLFSLNATISILTTAYTIALMQGVSTFIGQAKWLYFKTEPRRLADFETFDKASRDVWGSVLLLTTVKWNLATFGAVIMILRLSFSPFAQQVVLVEQRDVVSPASNNATFGYAYNYSRTAALTAGVNFQGNWPQDAGMQSAIFQGLFGIDTTEPFKCPGACRWPGSYMSLGFKAECKNVTQQTLDTEHCVQGTYNGTLYHGPAYSQATEQCNMTTPGGVMLGTRYQQNEFATEYYMNATSLLYFPAPAQTDPTLNFSELTRFGIYRSTTDSNYTRHNDINVTECSLYLTAYQYTDAKANGSDFSITRREIDLGPGNPWLAVPSKPDAEYDQVATANNITWNNISVPVFEVDFPNLEVLENFFTSPSIINEFVSGSFINPNIGVSAALTGDVDLGDRFDGMATGMTNYLRYSIDSQLALGEVLQSEPFVSIRWWYYAVPVVIEALAILFTILSIISNRRSGNIPLWKSSTLAILACQHNEQLEVLQTTGKGIDEIAAEAKNAKVQLQPKTMWI